MKDLTEYESKELKRLRRSERSAWKTANYFRDQYERERNVNRWYEGQIVLLSKGREDMIIRLIPWNENP